MLPRKPLALCTLLLLVLPAAAQTFVVATVKPAPQADPSTGTWSLPNTGSFTATHVPLTILLKLAYGIDASQIFNKPAWLDSALFDVSAKPEDGIRLSRDELQPRLQALLQDRFHLVAHHEFRPTRGFALTIAKGGAHLTPTQHDHFADFRSDISPGQMRGFNWSMPTLARYLTPAAGFPVVDQTGLTGSYDIAFSYAIDNEATADTTLPPLADALKQATGLVLKPQQVSVPALVLDSIERVPTPD